MNKEWTGEEKKSHAARLDSVSLYRKRMGGGAPIIILHGMFGMSDNWYSIGKRLAERNTVIIPDARNHGRSPHTEEMNYPLMAADIYRLMEEENIEKATLIGHSMGGKTVMQFLMDYPEHVEQLVVVDIAPRKYPPGHQMILDAFKSVNLKVSSRQEIESQLLKKVPTKAIAQFLMKNLKRSSDGYFSWKLNVSVIEKGYPALIDAIKWNGEYPQPALLIKGAHSPYIKDSDVVAFKKVLPDSTLSVIEGAGHWVHAEQPELFYRDVHHFILKRKK